MKLQIELLSDWHCGSGLSSGAHADSLVIKDKNNLPFIPGKTIKGLLKDALLEMQEVGQVNQEDINTIFGKEIKDENNKVRTKKGKAHFSNAELEEATADELIENPSLTPFLYRTVSQTTIGDNGIAKGKSLRTTEVCMPVVLETEITELTKEQEELILKASKYLRSLGVNRNRGLGRCKITILKESKNA